MLSQNNNNKKSVKNYGYGYMGVVKWMDYMVTYYKNDNANQEYKSTFNSLRLANLIINVGFHKNRACTVMWEFR